MTNIAVLIVAAGRGTRAGGKIPKQYRLLAGKPVLRHAIDSFQAHPFIRRIQVVVHPDDLALYDNAIDRLSLPAPVIGGAERQQSVFEGLKALASDEPDIVLIHDAARPFVPTDVIDRLIEALTADISAIPGLPVADTVKRADGHLNIETTVDRRNLFRVQTPQAFRFRDILDAHEKLSDLTATDDATLLEMQGKATKLVPGDPRCMKLTTAEDFIEAERMFNSNALPRVGSGFDVHRFGPGTSVTICGVDIPHSHGLVGHSDADVGLHALTDALLGAIAAGDIGQHFPPSDPQWRGAPSDRFLAHAKDLIEKRQGRIVNVDVTLICQAPKIGPHRAEMEQRIAEILDIPQNSVSVKATTTEKLGFAGREEGIAAQAVAMVLAP